MATMEDLDLTLEIVNGSGDHERLLARLSCMRTAIAAWQKVVAVYSTERVMLRHKARILRDSREDPAR